MTGAPGSCRFGVRLTPRAGRDEVLGVDESGTLLARVTAPPVDGAANEALIRLLAQELGVARSSVVITSGVTARVKRLRVEVAPRDVRARWPGILTVD